MSLRNTRVAMAFVKHALTTSDASPYALGKEVTRIITADAILTPAVALMRKEVIVGISSREVQTWKDAHVV